MVPLAPVENGLEVKLQRLYLTEVVKEQEHEIALVNQLRVKFLTQNITRVTIYNSVNTLRDQSKRVMIHGFYPITFQRKGEIEQSVSV